MEAVSITLTILSLCLTALSITFVILNFGRGKGKDGLQSEARLVSIEKDVQYIRMKVDGLQERQELLGHLMVP
jgi:hypothetical protein